MRVFVTGGTGYLGSHVVKQLLTAGYEVRMLARNPQKAKAGEGVEVVKGDLVDASTYSDKLEGCQFAIHMAAHVTKWPPDGEQFDRVNVEGTKAFIEAAQKAGCEKIIYTSTFMAIGPSGDKTADETHFLERKSFINGYERTKTAAYLEVEEMIANGAPIVVLMPAVMIGPGPDTPGNYLLQFLRDFKGKKLPGLIGSGETKLTLVHVRDVARAHVEALKKAETGAKYLLGGEIVTLNELCSILEKLTGVAAPKRRIGFGVSKMMAAMVELPSYITGGPPMLTRHEVEVFKRNWAYSSDKAVKELSYEITPLEEALKEALKAL